MPNLYGQEERHCQELDSRGRTSLEGICRRGDLLAHNGIERISNVPGWILSEMMV